MSSTDLDPDNNAESATLNPASSDSQHSPSQSRLPQSLLGKGSEIVPPPELETDQASVAESCELVANQVTSAQDTAPGNPPADKPTGRLRWWALAFVLLVPLAIVIPVYITVTSAVNTGGASVAVSSTPIHVELTRVGDIEAPQLSTNFRGVVTARRESALSFRFSGPVAEVFVNAGATLVTGEAIATLDISDLNARAELADSELSVAQAEYEQAIAGPRRQTIKAAVARVDQFTAQLTEAKSRLVRHQNLYRARAVPVSEVEAQQRSVKQLAATVREADSQLRELIEGTRSEEIQAAKARVDVAKASRKLIEIQTNDSRISAPFDCVVSERLIDEGTVVSPNQIVVRIIEKPPLECDFGLPAEVASNLSVGDKVSISVGKNSTALKNALTGRAAVKGSIARPTPTLNQINATVVRKQPRVDPVTITQEVVVEFESENVSLIGQPATLWLDWTGQQTSSGVVNSINGDRRSFWVPTDALVRNVRGLWAIYVAQPTARRSEEGAPISIISLRDAKIKKTAGAMTQIQSNVAADELLVSAGTHRIAPGVEVVDYQQTPTSGSLATPVTTEVR